MYFYRCTEQQLGDALNRISESGDRLLFPVFKGGRDWVLICEKGEQSTGDVGRLRRLADAADMLGPALAPREKRR